VRVIAATNCDLEEMCSREQFRRDLYYRLNVFPIHIPALRERTEDLPLLADVMLAKLNRNHPTRVRRVHPSVMRALQNYTWPGNVRELENLLERALILENASTLTLDSFPPEVTSGARPGHTPQVGVPDTSLGLEEARARAVAEFERRYLRVLLSVHGGRIARTAEAAGITTRHLHNLMQRHGLRKEDFKQKTGPKPEVPDPNSGRDSEL
jgi:DNA-binding NtrC family response regulator